MRYGLTGMALRIVLILAFLAVWEAVVRAFDVPAFILPPPSNIFLALYRGFASALYFSHIGVTLTETFLGFALGSILAFALGVAVALSRRVEYFLYPFIVMFQAMPKVALAPHSSARSATSRRLTIRAPSGPSSSSWPLREM